MLHAQHRNNEHQMILLLFKDARTWVSLMGISMIAVVQWITNNINPLVATVTMLLGLVLLLLGIVEKWQIVKAKWRQKLPLRKK